MLSCDMADTPLLEEEEEEEDVPIHKDTSLARLSISCALLLLLLTSLSQRVSMSDLQQLSGSFTMLPLREADTPTDTDRDSDNKVSLLATYVLIFSIEGGKRAVRMLKGLATHRYRE